MQNKLASYILSNKNLFLPPLVIYRPVRNLISETKNFANCEDESFANCEDENISIAFSSLSTSGGDVQRGALFHSILIKPDDDDDDFYNNSSKKLSLVLDELERFLKKGKSSEFNSRHDGGISGWPTPLQVPL